MDVIQTSMYFGAKRYANMSSQPIIVWQRFDKTIYRLHVGPGYKNPTVRQYCINTILGGLADDIKKIDGNMYSGGEGHTVITLYFDSEDTVLSLKLMGWDYL